MRVEHLISSTGEVLNGPLLLTPQLFGDDRGYFFESWNQRGLAAALEGFGQIGYSFVQDNHSLSGRGVLRGLHYQLPPHPQGKLVRCIAGEVFDVAIDLRRTSPTCGQWGSVRLNGNNHQQLWIPQGFAHGFLTLTHQAQVLYKTTDFWSRDCERSIRWDHPELAIDWPLWELEGLDPLLSEKDAAGPVHLRLAELDLFP